MKKQALFLVIEGLDGSGKSTVGRVLASELETKYDCQVRLTFEPHNASCGGAFLRDVLEKRVTDFHPRVLPLGFAANRLDHNARVITPWLEKKGNRVVICDRYYLSSLVYQSSEDFPIASVMALNEKARKPDILFFLNVSNEICYERMKNRNQPKELFEDNLDRFRQKYFEAIEFLKKEHGDNIVEIDGGGTVAEVVETILSFILAS